MAYHDVYETARVVDKKQRMRLCCHFLIVFLWSLGLAIPTGIFLFGIEEDNLCYAPIHASDFWVPFRWVNVSRRFFVALTIFFVFWMIEMVRALMVLLSTITKIHVISLVHTVLCLNELLGLAAMIVLSMYRFQFSGRYCSCSWEFCPKDLLEEIPIGIAVRERLLVRRGRMLLALAITYWVFLAFNFCMHTVTIRKRDPAVSA